MSGYAAIASFSSLAVLALGLATFLAAVGVGDLVMRRWVAPLDTFWRWPSAALCGLAMFAVLVECIAIAAVATPAVLIGTWGVFAAAGLACSIVPLRDAVRAVRASAVLWRREGLWLLLPALPLAINSTAALAPSTKIDELYYHMLLPARIVRDGGLHFYRMPILSAILPQMGFQIGMTPFHAMGRPDAGNIVSWCMSVLLTIFVSAAIVELTSSALWAGLVSAAVVSGGYAVVWHVSSGAHAIGDLASCCAGLALWTMGRSELSALQRRRLAGCAALFTACAAATKLSLTLVMAALVFVCWVLALRDRGEGSRLPLTILMVAPWAALFVPLAAWSWSASGSPFGPVLADRFGSTVYPHGFAPWMLASLRDQYLFSLRFQFKHIGVSYPMLLLAAFFAAVLSTRMRRASVLLLLLFSLQAIILVARLPWDLRFLGGLQYAVVIVGTVALADAARESARPRMWQAAAIVLWLPWVGVQIVYARPFVARLTGRISNDAFLREYVPLFDDYRRLDAILPRDAVLLATSRQFMLASYYSPRPIVFYPGDGPAPPTHLLIAGASHPLLTPPPARIGAEVYRNESAVVAAYRVDRRPRLGEVRVLQLRPAGR